MVIGLSHGLYMPSFLHISIGIPLTLYICGIHSIGGHTNGIFGHFSASQFFWVHYIIT